LRENRLGQKALEGKQIKAEDVEGEQVKAEGVRGRID